MTLNIKQLSYVLHHHALIDRISFDFQPGMIYGILGPNGSGKSTLLKSISRIWTPTSGELLWKGRDLLKFTRIEMCQTLSLVPQNPPFYFDCTVSHMAAMGCYAYGCRSVEAQERVRQALEQVNLLHLDNQLLSQLSGGERQRVYIARALASGAPILLLDEPTSHLDLRHQLEIWQILHKLKAEGKLVIVAVHDLMIARRFCDELVTLSKGQCKATGRYDEVIDASLLQEIFGVTFNEEAKVFDILGR